MTGAEIGKADKSAINQNFGSLENEVGNCVHRSSTETVRGFKYFSNEVGIAPFSAIRGTRTPGAAGMIVYDSVALEWCGSTGTSVNTWVRMSSPTMPCAN